VVQHGLNFLLVIVELFNVCRRCVNRIIDNLYLTFIKQEIFLLEKKVYFEFFFLNIFSFVAFIEFTTIYDTLSFNYKLDQNELENFFECCDLSATPYEIEEALETVLQCNFYLVFYSTIYVVFLDYPHKKNDPLTKDIVFDVIYYIYPPIATGLDTSRKSTWVRPIIDGEDETAIRG
jgi:hypothetical protein